MIHPDGPEAAHLQAKTAGQIDLDDYPELLAQLKMIHLSSQDMELLAASRPVILSQIERITGSFYESIQRVDSLSDIVTRFTTVERLRQALSHHLVEMFGGGGGSIAPS